MSFPSYALWDASNANAFYLATGSAIVPNDSPIGGDDGGTAQAHLLLHQVPKAFEVDYTWSPFFHFAVRNPSDYARKTIGSALSIPENRVGLALFSGLVLEDTYGTLDTVSGAAEAGWAAVKQAYNNAVSGNWYGLGSDAVGAAAAYNGAPPNVKDANYYRVTVDERQFHWAVPNAKPVFAAVVAAYDAGASIADALASFPSTSMLAHLVALHQENEARALQAVKAPEFSAFVADLDGEPRDVAAAWLRDAGVSMSLVPSFQKIKKIIGGGFLTSLGGGAGKSGPKVTTMVRTPALHLTGGAPLAPSFGAGQLRQQADNACTGTMPGGYWDIPHVGCVSRFGAGAVTVGAIGGAILVPSQRIAGAALGAAGGLLAALLAASAYQSFEKAASK